MKATLAILTASLLVIARFNSESKDERDQTIRIPPPPMAGKVLGYDEVLADSLWINLIQNSDYCENKSSAPTPTSNSNDLQEILSHENAPSRCNLGWVYHMSDEITNLAPRFRYAYMFSALNLTVSVDDREGARRIFEKGVKQFPDYWQLAYAASYHYLFEIKDPQRAADLLLQANRFGGPSWFPSLAARLYSAAGRKALGMSVLQEYLKTDPNEEGVKRAKKRLKELQDLPDSDK